MIRALLSVGVAAMAVAVLLAPGPDTPAPEASAPLNPPSVAVCPVEEGSGRSTTVAIASAPNGAGRLTTFAGGAAAGSVQFDTGASGSAAVPMADVAAVGTAAGLAELPGPRSAAGALLVGAESVAMQTCLSTPDAETLLTGGSTTADRQFQVQLMNPYAGQAMVDLIVQSESGLETAPQLRGITVPSRSSVVLDMSEILAGRESLAIAVDVVEGGVMTTGRFGAGADVALWRSTPPALDWYVPVPTSAFGGQLLISTGIGAEVEFQLDLHGPEGLVEAFLEGVVPERGVAVVPISDLGLEKAGAVRVVSTQPVAVFLRSVADSGVAITSGSPVTAPTWLIPAAGLAPGSAGSVVVLNAGLDETMVVVTAHGEQPASKEVSLPGGAVVGIPAFEGRANSYTVSGEGSLVALWVTRTKTGRAYTLGVPVVDE